MTIWLLRENWIASKPSMMPYSMLTKEELDALVAQIARHRDIGRNRHRSGLNATRKNLSILPAFLDLGRSANGGHENLTLVPTVSSLIRRINYN